MEEDEELDFPEWKEAGGYDKFIEYNYYPYLIEGKIDNGKDKGAVMEIKYEGNLSDDRVERRNVNGYLLSQQGYNSRVYYSKSLPSKEAPNYNPDTYDYKFMKEAVNVKDLVLGMEFFTQTNQNGYTNKPVLTYEQLAKYVIPIQEHLIKIGYLDKGDDDGVMGPNTQGAIKRYELNKPGIIEEAWHGIKKIDMNIFD